MRFLRAALVVALTIGVGGTSAVADQATESAALKALFQNPKLDPAAFTTNFASAVPLEGVQSFIDSYKSRMGDPTAFDRDGYQFRIRSAKGSIGCNIALDQQGKVSSLLFHDEMSASDLAALQKVMVAPHADATMFEDSFMQDVPMKRVDDIITGLRTKLGGFERVDSRKKGYFAVFERGEEHVQISVTADGKIDYLAFTAP